MIDSISLQARNNLSTGGKITVLLWGKKSKNGMIIYDNWKIEL